MEAAILPTEMLLALVAGTSVMAGTFAWQLVAMLRGRG